MARYNCENVRPNPDPLPREREWPADGSLPQLIIPQSQRLNFRRRGNVKALSPGERVWVRAGDKPETRSWRTLAPDFGGGSGGMWAGNSGDKSHAVQTLRVGRAAPNFAPAFGLRVLEHRFGPPGHEVTAWDGGHFHFGVRVETDPLRAGSVPGVPKRAQLDPARGSTGLAERRSPIRHVSEVFATAAGTVSGAPGAGSRCALPKNTPPKFVFKQPGCS